MFLGSGAVLIMQVLVLRLVLFLFIDSGLYCLGLFLLPSRVAENADWYKRCGGRQNVFKYH